MLSWFVRYACLFLVYFRNHSFHFFWSHFLRAPGGWWAVGVSRHPRARPSATAGRPNDDRWPGSSSSNSARNKQFHRFRVGCHPPCKLALIERTKKKKRKLGSRDPGKVFQECCKIQIKFYKYFVNTFKLRDVIRSHRGDLGRNEPKSPRWDLWKKNVEKRNKFPWETSKEAKRETNEAMTIACSYASLTRSAARSGPYLGPRPRWTAAAPAAALHVRNQKLISPIPLDNLSPVSQPFSFVSNFPENSTRILPFISSSNEIRSTFSYSE